MKRVFYLYKYRKDGGTLIKIHQNIEKYIKSENKSMAIISQESGSKYFYTLTTVPIPEKFFFVKDCEKSRPIYIDNSLIATIVGEDDSVFPFNENMDELRNKKNIINICGPLNIEKYSIVINMYIKELNIPYESLKY